MVHQHRLHSRKLLTLIPGHGTFHFTPTVLRPSFHKAGSSTPQDPADWRIGKHQHLAHHKTATRVPHSVKTDVEFGRSGWRIKLASIQLPLRQQLCSAGKVATINPGRNNTKKFFPRVMISRKSSSQLSTTSSTFSKKSASSAGTSVSDFDTEEQDTMAGAEHSPHRPLLVAIPTDVQGPYCPRRPGLGGILANTAPTPWTLTAFMAYLSNNHCLETLEFTMDAGRYRKHYAKMLSKATNGPPPSKDMEYVMALWHRLVDAYIRPNGSREVNLPSDVRDPILNLKLTALPPAPETLDLAVTKIYELMEESVLVPFLNSVYPQTALPAMTSHSYHTANRGGPTTSGPYEDRSAFSRRSRHVRSSPPPQSAVEPLSNSAPVLNNRKSAPSTLTTSLSRARFSVKLSPTTSAPAVSTSSTAHHDLTSATSDANLSSGSDTTSGRGPGLTTDDSGSTDSPLNESPMTPPMSPPVSDVSPKRDSAIWKKLGRLSGMKVGKKKSHGGLPNAEMQ
ncbi:hypothetical protein LTR74_001452 [Friedmanniomyces endolithicus]|nr:hypothetical protein LTR74_001452 [Friedmanniomyces endolithicus]